MSASFWKIPLFVLLSTFLAFGCAVSPPPERVKSSGFFSASYIEGQAAQVKSGLAQCSQQANPSPQVVTADKFTLNVRICIAYAGDGPRPLNPWNPEDWEQKLTDLESGEVYFMAFIKDSGADTQKLTIQSDLIKGVIRSNDYLYAQDLYHGTPTDSLDVYIGVFDDDGWPSNKADQLKTLQKSVGQTLELFPPAAPYIPFLQPIVDLVPALMDLFDPDDTFVTARVIVTRNTVQAGGQQQTQWRLENPVSRNDNGMIILTRL